ncbi:MAG: hypothetical protein EOP65_07175 [Sphingomonas sp.]|nr:MAG: hypothetical protein EOP65_07175 [Sphingomonas sp.]
MACRRHDGGGGKRHVCSVSSPSVTAAPRHLPLAGEELASTLNIESAATTAPSAIGPSATQPTAQPR